MMKKKNLVIGSYDVGADAILQEDFTEIKDSDTKIKIIIIGVVFILIGVLLCL